MGCHFLLQCIKVKSESEVAQSCLTPSDPMDCSPPGSSVHGIFQARVLEWGAIAFSIINSKLYQIHKEIMKSFSFYLFGLYVFLSKYLKTIQIKQQTESFSASSRLPSHKPVYIYFFRISPEAGSCFVCLFANIKNTKCVGTKVLPACLTSTCAPSAGCHALLWDDFQPRPFIFIWPCEGDLQILLFNSFFLYMTRGD